MPRKDYYQILGVNQNATSSEIKRTYKKLSSQLHPDKITEREQTEKEKEKLVNVLEAYEVLNNPTERKKYDLYIGKYAAEDENTELIDLNYVEEIKKLIQECLRNSGIEKEEILELNPWINDNSESKSEKEEFIIGWETTLALLTSKLSIEVEVENTKSDIAAKCNMLLKVINDTAEKKRNINDFLEEVNKEMNKEPQVKPEFLGNNWSRDWNFRKHEEVVRRVYSKIKNHGDEIDRRENEWNLLRLDRFKDDLSEEIEKTREKIKEQSKEITSLIERKDLTKIEKFLEKANTSQERALKKAVYENYQTEIQNLLAEKPFLQTKQELDDLIKEILTSEENFEEHLEKLNEFKGAEAETLKNKAWREVNGRPILVELINWKQKQGQDRQEMEDKLITYTQELIAKKEVAWSQLETTTNYWQSFQHYPPLNTSENFPEKEPEKHQLTRDVSPLLIEELLSKSVEIIISEEEEKEEETYNYCRHVEGFLKAIGKNSRNEEATDNSHLSFLKKILNIRSRLYWVNNEWEASRAWEKTQDLTNDEREDEREERLIFALFQFWSKTENKYASQYKKEAEKWLDNHSQKKKVPKKVLEENPVGSEPRGHLSTKRQITLNYLDNLIVEAAKNGQGDYSSLLTEKFHPPSNLKTSKNKVLRGEIDYSEAELNSLDSQEKVEKKLTQVAKTVFYYISHLKGGSGQPGEARQILNSFAELLKEEIVSETGVAFADWLFERQKKLEKGKNTTAQGLTENKPKISEFIGNNNDVTENNQKTSQTPVLDKNKATKISENQVPEPRTSTGITNTENHTDDNSLPQHLIDLDKYKNLWELVKNATQLQELDGKELSDENIDRLQLENVATFSIWWNKKLNLKYARDLKKELLTRGFTDEELTNELQQQKRENLQLGPESDWYYLFKSQKHETRRKDEISAIIITELPKIIAWKKFFAEKGITDPEHQKKWKQTGLSPLSDRPGILPQTERAWQNGWQDLTDPNISVENSRNGGIDYFYQEITEGGTKKNFLRINLLSIDYSEVKTFSSLVDKINRTKKSADIVTIKVSDELPALLKNRIIERKENKIREIQEIWKRFFRIHPEIDTPLKKRAWIKSGLNPVESLVGKADSEAEIAWCNGWTDLTINSPNDGIGKIELMNNGKVKYCSYGWNNYFDSLGVLVVNNKKDDLDKENFWSEFGTQHVNFVPLGDNAEDKKKAEKWRQKGYLPLEAAEYSYNCWDVESEAAAKNDPLHSGQAWYSDRWINMNISKKELIIDELKRKKFPITEQEFASQLSTHFNTDNWEKYLRTAKNFEELNNRQEKIQQIIKDYTGDKDKFFTEFAREINTDNIPEAEKIMAYYGKINTGQRAAEVYQAGINANELDENGLLTFKEKVYKLNEPNDLNKYLQAKQQQQLATEIAAENRKYDIILNRINNATTEAQVEVETNNINNLDPNKLTGDRNIQTLKNIQADRKNALYVPPRQDKPQEEDTNDTNLPKLEEEIDSDRPPIEIPLEENALDQPENEPLSKKTIAVMIVIGALVIGVVSVGVEKWSQKKKKLKTSKDAGLRKNFSLKAKQKTWTKI